MDIYASSMFTKNMQIMTQTLTVTEAARNFSDIVNRVYYQGQDYLLTRGGVVVAKLGRPEPGLSGKELARRWELLPRLDPEDAEQWGEELESIKRSIPQPGIGVWDY